MLKKGQIINLEHKAKQFVVLDTTEESVQIQFVNGRSYEVCRDGRIFGCDYKNTGERILLEQSTIRRGYKQINI